jgi:hypothetical protein
MLVYTTCMFTASTQRLPRAHYYYLSAAPCVAHGKCGSQLRRHRRRQPACWYGIPYVDVRLCLPIFLHGDYVPTVR